MEKRAPHYPLTTIQAEVARTGVAAFTKSALDGGRAMGLTSTEMLKVIASLTRRSFYNSMTTYADHRLWQDVYHATTAQGVAVYLKLTVIEDLLIVSFKEL